MKKYNETFYNLTGDECKNILDQYVAYTAIAEGNKKLKVIISHSDLDGVTSAINLVEAFKTFGDSDIIVFLERTSRSEMTSAIAEAFVENNPDEFLFYNTVEFAIADRMFIDLDRDFSYPENARFSWYDHHAGNVISEETIREKLRYKLVEYQIKTDIKHCGASITWEAMRDRILVDAGEWEACQYSNKLKIWSLNVNLWDTFQWKNDPDLGSELRSLGKKIGTIDKMSTGEKDLFKTLMEKLDQYGDLDNSEIYKWIDETNFAYKDLVDEVYKNASERAIEYTDKIVLLPSEWKFASNVKELWAENHPDNKIVITYHKSGGTVYTAVGYGIPSYDIAKFIGTRYRLNGGGHMNAAGFACLELGVDKFLSEEEMELIVKERVIQSLDAFFGRSGEINL